MRRALPPVGWHNTCMHPPHCTTVWAWLNTVVLWARKMKRAAAGPTKSEQRSHHYANVMEDATYTKE